VLRFPYGRVSTPDPDASTRKLDGVTPEAVGFNLKVVDDTEEAGLLLGVSRNIRPVGDGDGGAGQQSILPVNPTDLGDQVWRLNFSNRRPWLEVNSAIPDIMEVARSDRRFFSLVYPAVIRQILTRILVIDGWYSPDGNPDDWRVQWLKWGIHWHPDKARPAEGERDKVQDEWLDWIEEVTTAFCQQHGVRDKYVHPDGEEAGR